MSGERRCPWRTIPLTAYRLLLTAYLLPLTACSVTPLTNKIRIGEEAFVVAVGEGPDAMTDLYAAPAAGGAFVRFTFNRMQEAGPRLSTSGTRLVFLRSSPVETSDPEPEVVVLDLATGSERGVRIPRSSGAARAAGWMAGDSVVVVRADSGLWRFGVPPDPTDLRRLDTADRDRAESGLAVMIGDPPRASAVPCAGGGLCVRSLAGGGDTTSLDPGGSGPVRWSGDSVGYFTARGFEVRPLAGGRSRWPQWSGAPARLRGLTYHGGTQVTTATGVSGAR